MNAAQFASIKAAVAALPSDGGTLFIPSGNFLLDAADLDIVLDRAIHIVGESLNETKLFVTGTAGNQNRDMFRIQSDGCSIENLTIEGNRVVGTGVGIKIGRPDGTTLTRVSLRNVAVFGFSSYGVQITGYSGGSGYAGTDEFILEAVTVAASRSGAQFYIGSACTMGVLRSCRSYQAADVDDSSPTGVYGYHLVNCANIKLDTCECGPTQGTVGLFYEPTNQGQDPSDGGANFTMENCDFERTPAHTTRFVHVIGVTNVELRGNLFFNGAAGTEAVRLEGCHQPVLINNNFKAIAGTNLHLGDCTEAVLVNNLEEAADPGSERTAMRYSENAGTVGTTAIQQGSIRIPNLTTTQRNAITDKKPGMLIYNSTTQTVQVTDNALAWKNVP